MAVVVSEQDKARARDHMGYLGVQSSSTFDLGIPAGVQTQFMIEGAFSKILPSALPMFVKLLDRLDKLECELDESMEDLRATQVGSITLRDDFFEKLLQRYKYWRAKLGNIMGVPPNPYDFRFGGALAGDAPMGGLNVSVQH